MEETLEVSVLADMRGDDGVALSAKTREGLPELLLRAESLLWREGKVAAPQEEPFE